MPAVPPIFDGEKEAELIALACSKPPKGYARWTLRLLENKVVELGIVDRASDSTIGRTLKKTLSSPIAANTGSFRRRPTARFAPLEGWRHVKVTDRHTAVDYAHALKDLADTHLPTPGPWSWSKTISTFTARLRSMRPSPPPRPGGWLKASNGITPRRTAADTIWRNL